MVYAQTTPATPPVQQIEKIEVTGSRIPSPTLTSDSPVNVINAQDIAFTGLTNTSDIINQLPQAFADQGGNLSNGASGTSTVNLRNLGSTRTLVLIDGKRVPAGSPSDYATDLNAIPAPLIQRIEVLTGGASAVYGSDAIAGVVNFIMNDHFEGVQFQWNGNGFNHQQHNSVSSLVAGKQATNPAQYQVPGDVGLDGKVQDFSVTMGSNFANNKGNATIFFGYRNAEAVTQGTRDFSACALNASAAGFSCGGSGTSYPGQFFTADSDSFTIANAAGGVRPYKAATDAFNFGPYNYYQRPETKYTFNAFAHYDVLPNARVYGEFDFMDNHTVAQIAPSGSFGQSFELKNNNPLLSQEFKDAMGITADTPQTVYILRRNLEGGGRADDIRHTSYRSVIGVKGDLLDGAWNYNGWWQSGKVIYQETYRNDFSVTRLGQATDVIADPETGVPVCASGAAGCVPYDIFHLGGVTQGALNYLQTPGLKNGSTQQSVVGLNISSDLGSSYGWKTPWARNGAGVAFGIERRVEKLALTTDTAFSSGDLAGQGGATIGLGGQYTVTEAYTEFRLPIAERQPYAYDLSVSGSYRYSNYSTDQTTNSWGLTADWAPIREAKLRGSYQNAVRAANIIELFTAQGYNLFSGIDPCGGPTPTATAEQCARTGLSAAQYGSNLLTNIAGQYNFIQGGNPTLTPETAKTYTVGLVLQPLPNLSATLDYWSIKLKNQVGIVPSQFALQQCLDNGAYCGLIHRDAQGTLWLPNGGYIEGTNQNLGAQSTDGIDMTVNYTLPIDHYGSLGFNLIGTWLDKFETTPIPGEGTYDCAGYFGATCGTPMPEWRSKFGVVWNTPWNVSGMLAWRYFSAVDIDTTSDNPLLSGGYKDVNKHFGSQNYIDLAAQWQIDKNFSLRVGVNNVFDRDPPLASSDVTGPPFGSGNTYPQVYDTMGRNFFLNVSAKF